MDELQWMAPLWHCMYGGGKVDYDGSIGYMWITYILYFRTVTIPCNRTYACLKPTPCLYLN